LVFKYLKDASNNFFCDTLGLEIDKCETNKFHNLQCSKISIYQNDINHVVVFLFNEDTIKLIAKNLLFEDNLNEEATVDLLKEVANLIGGTAKTLLEEADTNSSYKLSTPDYIGFIKDFNEFDLICYSANKINNRCFILGIKES